MRSSWPVLAGILVSLVTTACGGDTEETSTSTGGTGGAGTGGATGGSTTSSSTTVDIGEPSDTYPAPHQPPPQVADYGGPVLHSPKFQPIFFSNDDPFVIAQILDFTSKVGATSYWTAVVGEYGVGPASSLPPVQLDETATGTITDDEVEAWLASKLDADDPAFATPDADTVYAIF